MQCMSHENKGLVPIKWELANFLLTQFIGILSCQLPFPPCASLPHPTKGQHHHPDTLVPLRFCKSKQIPLFYMEGTV
jgi:hypothetical protein